MDLCNTVFCDTCQDMGTVTQTVYDGPLGREVADVVCPDCNGEEPAFLPGVDDVLDGTREGWDR